MKKDKNSQVEEIITIKDFSETKFKEKRSVFNAQVFPVKSEEDFNRILSDVKKKFYDATHHCFAYRLQNGNLKYSDDGEPNGTAGIRIINAIDHFNLTNVLVIVIRYYGGTKLGVGPLGKAYYKSAEMTLNNAKKIKKTAYQKISITADFEFTSLLHKTFSDFEMKIIDTNYGENVTFHCFIKPKLIENFKDFLIDRTKGSVEIDINENINFL